MKINDKDFNHFINCIISYFGSHVHFNTYDTITIKSLDQKLHEIKLFDTKDQEVLDKGIGHILYGQGVFYHENKWLGKGHYIYGSKEAVKLYYKEQLCKKVAEKVITEMMLLKRPFSEKYLEELENKHKEEIIKSKNLFEFV